MMACFKKRERRNANTVSWQQLRSSDRHRMGKQKSRESVVEQLVAFILRLKGGVFQP
jgi:hypothetical protein